MSLNPFANALRHQREYVCLPCRLRTSSTSRWQRPTQNAFSTRLILPTLSPAVAASLYGEIDKLDGKQKIAKPRKRETKAKSAELRALSGKGKHTPSKEVCIAEPNKVKTKGCGPAKKIPSAPKPLVPASKPQSDGHDSPKAAKPRKFQRRDTRHVKEDVRRGSELLQTESYEETAENPTGEHTTDDPVVFGKRRKVGEIRAKRRAQRLMKARANAAFLEQNAEQSHTESAESFSVTSKDVVSDSSQTGPTQERISDSTPVDDQMSNPASTGKRSSVASPLRAKILRYLSLSKLRWFVPSIRVRRLIGQERKRIRLKSPKSLKSSSESPILSLERRKPGERLRSVGEKDTNLGDALQASRAEVKEINAMNLEIQSVPIAQPPVPNLAYGLERVLFNPGVYQLQDPRSRVYNFDPYLQKIMPASEFDFTALREYITSSRDTSLISIAKEQNKQYVGSSSSMTGTLAQFHFLLSQWREINTSMISRGFPDKLKSFTLIQRAPTAIFLKWKEGTYAIDADKMFDSSSILSMLGKSMEKLLTLRTEDFERYRKSSSQQVSDEERNTPDSFHYSTMGDFLMRSQLDAHDPRLPGTGMFDLKTRSVVTVRMDVQDPRRGAGYEIQNRLGEWESYEREYYDMMRAAFLKYSLQVRMGRMDGIFVAFHNTERIFGFQYVSLEEMDDTVHGQMDTTLGDQEFKLSLDLLNKILDRATERFPEQSIRIHFETREAVTPFMYIFAEPLTESQIEEIQSTNAAKIEEFEREMNGLPEEESVEENIDEEEKKWVDVQTEVDELKGMDESGEVDGHSDMELSTEAVISDEYTDGTDVVASYDEDADEIITGKEDHQNDEAVTGDAKEDEEIIAYEDDIIEEEPIRDLDEPAKEGEAILETDSEERTGKQRDKGLQETIYDENKTIKEESDRVLEESSGEGEKILMSVTEEMEQRRAEALEGRSEQEDQTQADVEHQTEASATLTNIEADQEIQALDARNNSPSKLEHDEGSFIQLQFKSPMLALGQSLKSALLGPTAQPSTASPSTEDTENIEIADATPSEPDLSTAADATFLNTLCPSSTESPRSPLLAMTLTISNKVDDKYILRPSGITTKPPPPAPKSENGTPPPAPKPSKRWTVEYSLVEISNAERAWSLYEACQARRKKALSQDDEVAREKRWLEPYMQKMRDLHLKGRKYREGVNQREGGKAIVVLGMEDKGGKSGGSEGSEDVD